MNDAKPARRPIPRPEHFPHRTVETIRFGDLDRQNHVNSAVFSTSWNPAGSSSCTGRNTG